MLGVRSIIAWLLVLTRSVGLSGSTAGGLVRSRTGRRSWVSRLPSAPKCLGPECLVICASVDASRVARLVAERLPWGCQTSPLRRSPPRSRLPPALPRASARCRQASNARRPRGLSPPRRVAPPGRSSPCCMRLPTLGFTGFRPRAVRRSVRLLARATSVSCLLSSAYPPKPSPSVQPYPRHREPFAPSPFGRLRVPGTSRPCSTRMSVAICCVAAPDSPLLPWAFPPGCRDVAPDPRRPDPPATRRCRARSCASVRAVCRPSRAPDARCPRWGVARRGRKRGVRSLSTPSPVRLALTVP